LRQSGKNYFGRRPRIRTQLERFDGSVVVHNNEAGECSSGVDPDAH
jgi:hypothetical protein